MIEIKCDICELQLDNHVTLLGNQDGISFDSATHKTHLFKMLQMQQRAMKLHSNKTVRFIDDPYVFHGIQFTENDCLIIDEFNYAPNELDDLLSRIRAANAWLIVIGRLFMKQLEYGVDSIISFRIVDSEHVTFSPYFEPVVLSEHIPDIAACEDSTSVAAVFSNSSILHELSDFYNNRKVENFGRCYSICVDSIHFAEYNDFTVHKYSFVSCKKQEADA